MRVYLAGAIGGLNWEDSYNWRNRAGDYFEDHEIETISPLTGKEDLNNLSLMANQTTYNIEEIVLRDLADIDRSDVLLVEMIHRNIHYIGTLNEMFYAKLKNKPVVIWHGDNDLHTKSWNAWRNTNCFAVLGDAMDYIVNYWNR